MDRELAQSCANGEMQLEYQPIVDTQRRDVIGYEALVRWQHPIRYSSLSYLRRLPLDKLKINRTFVEELATSGEAISVLEAIVHLANKLGMETVAEGIETPEQAKIVSQLGTQMQDFLFGRPEPFCMIDKLGEKLGGPKG